MGQGSALVLGGGGVTGIAWELGILAGLAHHGIDLSTADVVIGTSAGSVVGAQITSGPVAALYERQLEPPSAEITANLGNTVKLRFGVALVRSHGNLESFGRHLGAASIKAAKEGKLPTLESRYRAISSRLTSTEWPDRTLKITAVNARTGAFTVFDRAAGVDLIDAIASSCAVPTVYPPVHIGSEIYIDGGVRSGSNVDLAAGCDRVIVLAPLPDGVGPLKGARQQANALGIPSLVIAPDHAAVAAIGKNVLDPAARAASAKAGYAQAATVVDAVRAVWSS